MDKNIDKTHLQIQKSKQAQDLRHLFIDELKDIYWAEKAVLKAMPLMVEIATSAELIKVLNDHMKQTHDHVIRVEKVFTMMGEKPEAKKCEAMEGLIKEAGEIINKTQKGVVRDAGIILASQKIEHYEIATYGTLSAFAKTIEEDEVVIELRKTLTDEKQADVMLTEIAEKHINLDAADIDDDGPNENDPIIKLDNADINTKYVKEAHNAIGMQSLASDNTKKIK